MAYSKEELRHIFQNKFDREAWKAILSTIFGAQKVRSENELFTEPDAKEVGYYVGKAETPDSFRIGLFYYKINSGSVAHKKVGLRNLVKKFINQNWGEFDAAIVVFDDGSEWRLSFVCDIKEEATAPKRFTYVFGEHDNFYRTAIDRFEGLQAQQPTFENIRKAFSVDALSDDFFDTYREMYADFVQYITGKRYVKENNKWVERELSTPNYQFETTFENDGKLVRDYIKKMFGRIVFLYFLQRKGWLDGNRQYMHDLFANSDKKDNFLDGVLETLFFEVLNTDKPYRTSEAKTLPGNENIPYLNGGLFAKDGVDERTCVFPAEYFAKLFDFLDSYNFTIDENDTDDAEIGIDPEMLGRIFENLLEDNKDKGTFYTPKEIVDYMCRESIITYLLNGIPERSHDLIRRFVETFDGSSLSLEQRSYIKDKLKTVKICDPAIGSGAFPMGLVNLLSKLYSALRVSTDASVIKRHIMEQNIYGVDIERGAVDIARLRFWLAMIVEEKEPIPLPNLHFKIMQGNSLLESFGGVDLSDLTKVGVKSNLFDSENSERESLIAALNSYYKTSDHQKRDRLFYEIINNVRRQLHDKNIALPQGLDPSANTDFFLWHTWFADVFEKGGFDIVIGNPPYIDSETMTNSQPELRNTYKKLYSTACGNWDIFIVFIELGISLLKEHGVFSYIIPNKVIAAKYAEASRRLLCNNNLKIIRDYGSVPVFEAAVYPCVILLTKDDAVSDKMFQTMKDLVNPSNIAIIPYVTFSYDLFWDKYFINQAKLDIILKVSNQPKLSTYDVEITGAATVAEAYKIKEVLTELDATQSEPYLRFINTGTIDKYKSLWGIKKTQYIKGSYQHPIIKTKDLQKINKNRVFQSLAPKIIIAGMSSSVEAIFDGGEIIAGKSTSIIRGDTRFLKAILAVINSKLLDFWLRINFNSLKMAGGYINVGVNEISSLPIHSAAFDVPTLIEKVDKLLLQPDDNTTIDEIDLIIYHLYELSYDEVLIVDPQTPISREEYESFKL